METHFLIFFLLFLSSVFCPIFLFLFHHTRGARWLLCASGLKEENKKNMIFFFSVINSESCFCLLYHVWIKVLILYVAVCVVHSPQITLFSGKNPDWWKKKHEADVQVWHHEARRSRFVLFCFELINTVALINICSIMQCGNRSSLGSVQQDPRASAGRWHCTTTLRPLEGAPS